MIAILLLYDSNHAIDGWQSYDDKINVVCFTQGLTVLCVVGLAAIACHGGRHIGDRSVEALY